MRRCVICFLFFVGTRKIGKKPDVWGQLGQTKRPVAPLCEIGSSMVFPMRLWMWWTQTVQFAIHGSVARQSDIVSDCCWVLDGNTKNF